MRLKILIVLIILISLGMGGFFAWKNLILPKEKVEAPSEEIIPEEGKIVPPEEEKMEKEKVEEKPREEVPEQPLETTSTEEIEGPKVPELKFVWTQDSGIRITDGSVPYVNRLKDGRFRLYYCGAGGILSAISSDGLNFEKEQGVRIAPVAGLGNPESMVCDATIIDLPDGRIRMYYKGATGLGGPGQAVHRIFSAISSDGLNFQKEGLRIDSTKTNDDGWASVPEAIKLPDGRIRIYYVSDANDVGHGVVSSISNDGLNFVKEETKLAGFVDPAITILPNGRYLLVAVALPFGPGGVRYSDVQPGIYSFVSNDGINFENRQLVLAKENSLDPSIIKINENTYRIFYGELTGTTSITKSITGFSQ